MGYSHGVSKQIQLSIHMNIYITDPKGILEEGCIRIVRVVQCCMVACTVRSLRTGVLLNLHTPLIHQFLHESACPLSHCDCCNP